MSCKKRLVQNSSWNLDKMKRKVDIMKEKEEYYCEVCGRKISKEEYETYDGLCWECWDDQMTEECEFEEDIA